MKKKTIILISFVLFVCLKPLHAQLSCSDCDFVIDKNTGVVNGLDLNVQPGDVIGLAGTPDTYKNLTFNDIVGTEENPIIIKNCDGQAVISSTGSFGVKFRNSKNFKLEGDGDSEYDYGIKISTTNGFFLTFEKFTTDFEVHSVEIAGLEPNGIGDDNGFAGIGIKTSPYQDCDLFTDPTRTAWIMENIHVHDCYIHDVGGEGLYIGHGFYNGRIESACTDIVFPIMKELNFEIIPTAGWTRPMARERSEKLRAISKDTARQADWNAYLNAQALSDSTYKATGKVNDPYFIHTDEYDRIQDLFLQEYNRLFNVELGLGGWENINIAHYWHIEKALEKHRYKGKRMLIIYGAGHKGWFMRELRKREDITLLEMKPFLDAVGGGLRAEGGG